MFIISKESIKLIANNKKAYHDYFIDDKWEAGIELFGTEVKSIRMGKCSIKEAFVKIDKGEVYVYGMHISPYEKGNIFNKDPLRVRKLLLHKYEIMKLNGKIAEKGYTLMPLQVYFKGSLVKVQVGLARGKKLLLYAFRDASFIGEDTLIIVEASLNTDFDWAEDAGYEILKKKIYKTNVHVFLTPKSKHEGVKES